MEFFSVMRVAQEFNIPAGGIFCITNFCNADAHEAFRSNQAKAMQLLVDYLQTKELSELIQRQRLRLKNV